MISIPLANVPNQSFTIRLNSASYNLRVHDCGNGVTTMDIVINEVPLITGARVVSNYPIIGYDYLEDGNFMIQTQNYEYPDYTKYGVTQYLIFATQAEIEAINASSQ